MWARHSAITAAAAAAAGTVARSSLNRLQPHQDVFGQRLERCFGKSGAFGLDNLQARMRIMRAVHDVDVITKT